MRITCHTVLGYRLLLYLASASPKCATIPQIAHAYKVSENHLRKVALHLNKLGLVTSTRGKGGGLKLAKDPTEISIGWTMRKLEPDSTSVTCIGSNTQALMFDSSCALYCIFEAALNSWYVVLDSYTLADALTAANHFNHSLYSQPIIF